LSKRSLVDSNLIVRFLVQDREKHAQAAGKLFDACDRGDVVIVVLPAVLAECVFVLESFYEHPRGDIASALGRGGVRHRALARETQIFHGSRFRHHLQLLDWTVL
jgi:predicted nucleic acid-binding protein